MDSDKRVFMNTWKDFEGGRTFPRRALYLLHRDGPAGLPQVAAPDAGTIGAARES